MKKNLLLAIVFILLLILNGKAQVVSTNSSLIEIADNPNEKTAFTFTSFQTLEDELEEVENYDSHFLGDAIAKKSHIIRNLYVKHSEVTVGFGNVHVEVQKPIVYNALNKIEAMLKKELRKGIVTKEKAAIAFSRYLDVAYVVYYDANTESFEQVLQKSKGAPELIEVFESVEIEKL